MTVPVVELPPCFRPLRVEEYDRLIDQGVFDGTHVELIGGVLVEMSPQGDRHIGVILYLNRLLVRLAADDLVVSVQSPLITDEVSEPEPDFAVLPWRDYRRHGKPREALLVIEVASSSLSFDLGEKARRYALANCPEYWVVDVNDKTVHVHRRPDGQGGWGDLMTATTGTLTAVASPQIEIDLDDLFDY